MLIKIERVENGSRAVLWHGSSADARKTALALMQAVKGGEKVSVSKPWLKLLDSRGVLI